MLSYRRISYAIAAAIISCGAFFLVHPALAAEKDCGHIKNVNRRFLCVEQNVHDLALKLQETNKKLEEANNKLAGKVRGIVQGSLQRVKIEQAAHPGICLFFKDRNEPAYAILDCSHTPEQTFNIHQ